MSPFETVRQVEQQSWKWLVCNVATGDSSKDWTVRAKATGLSDARECCLATYEPRMFGVICFDRKNGLKTLTCALVGWVFWLECHPVHQRVASLIPSRAGCMQEATDRCFSLSFPSSLSKINKYIFRWGLKTKQNIDLWLWNNMCYACHFFIHIIESKTKSQQPENGGTKLAFLSYYFDLLKLRLLRSGNVVGQEQVRSQIFSAKCSSNTLQNMGTDENSKWTIAGSPEDLCILERKFLVHHNS